MLELFLRSRVGPIVDNLIALHNDNLYLLHPHAEGFLNLSNLVTSLAGSLDLVRNEEEAFEEIIVDVEADVACCDIMVNAYARMEIGFEMLLIMRETHC